MFVVNVARKPHRSDDTETLGGVGHASTSLARLCIANIPDALLCYIKTSSWWCERIVYGLRHVLGTDSSIICRCILMFSRVVKRHVFAETNHHDRP